MLSKMTEKEQKETECDSTYEGNRLCRYVSMPSRLIFDSSVWRGIPSFAAAPDGPDIRPWASARAASIISASRLAIAERPRFADDSVDLPFSQPSSTTKASLSLRMTVRSTTFCSSRILPANGSRVTALAFVC
jgi:hypothetical protein